jgi:hypothetical protein
MGYDTFGRQLLEAVDEAAEKSNVHGRGVRL